MIKRKKQWKKERMKEKKKERTKEIYQKEINEK